MKPYRAALSNTLSIMALDSISKKVDKVSKVSTNNDVWKW